MLSSYAARDHRYRDLKKPEGLAGREGLIQAPLYPGGPGQEGDS
jgi:hypothetical protein